MTRIRKTIKLIIQIRILIITLKTKQIKILIKTLMQKQMTTKRMKQARHRKQAIKSILKRTNIRKLQTVLSL